MPLSMANSQILAETDRLGQSGRGGPCHGQGLVAQMLIAVIMNSPSTRTDVRPSSHFRI